MIHRQGFVATPLAGTFLVRLCKHFSKKINVDYDPENAREGFASFPFGECHLRANEEQLTFACRAESAEAMAEMQKIIGLHVGMFSRRDPLSITWPEPD